MILKLLLKGICLVQIRRLSRWSSSQKLVEGGDIILILRVVVMAEGYTSQDHCVGRLRVVHLKTLMVDD